MFPTSPKISFSSLQTGQSSSSNSALRRPTSSLRSLLIPFQMRVYKGCWLLTELTKSIFSTLLSPVPWMFYRAHWCFLQSRNWWPWHSALHCVGPRNVFHIFQPNMQTNLKVKFLRLIWLRVNSPAVLLSISNCYVAMFWFMFVLFLSLYWYICNFLYLYSTLCHCKIGNIIIIITNFILILFTSVNRSHAKYNEVRVNRPYNFLT